jgi:hypothetical protein
LLCVNQEKKPEKQGEEHSQYAHKRPECFLFGEPDIVGVIEIQTQQMIYFGRMGIFHKGSFVDLRKIQRLDGK